MLLLARTWLHCTPREVLERLTPGEIAELQAEYAISPWDESRGDVRQAYGAAATLAAAGCKDVKLSDWMPKYDEAESRQSAEQMRAVLAANSELVRK